jgi:hypothetical protein
MTLQEFASLGAAISGLGVILGLIYTSIQIRHNTLAVRSSALQQVVNSFAAISFDIAKERPLVETSICVLDESSVRSMNLNVRSTACYFLASPTPG